MKGHGHVTPNPDGSRARCGGPPMCSVCARELAQLNQPTMSGRISNELCPEQDQECGTDQSKWCVSCRELVRSRELLTRLDEKISRMQREKAYSDADCILSELSGLMQEYRS